MNKIILKSYENIELYKRFKERLINTVLAELLSYKDINRMINYHPFELIESFVKKHSILFEHGIEIGSFNSLMKKLALLYRIHFNMGIPKQFFKLEILAWSNSIKSLLVQYPLSKELISLYDFFSLNFDNLLESDELYKSFYTSENNEDYLSLIRKLACHEENLENALPKKSNDKNVFSELFLPSLEKTKHFFIKGLFDELEAVNCISALYSLAKSCNDKPLSAEQITSIITSPPQFEPLECFFNHYSYIEANLLVSYINSIEHRATFLPFDDIFQFTLKNSIENIYIINSDIFNLSKIIKMAHLFKNESILRNCKLFISGPDLKEDILLPENLKYVHRIASF